MEKLSQDKNKLMMEQYRHIGFKHALIEVHKDLKTELREEREILRKNLEQLKSIREAIKNINTSWQG